MALRERRLVCAEQVDQPVPPKFEAFHRLPSGPVGLKGLDFSIWAQRQLICSGEAAHQRDLKLCLSSSFQPVQLVSAATVDSKGRPAKRDSELITGVHRGSPKLGFALKFKKKPAFGEPRYPPVVHRMLSPKQFPDGRHLKNAFAQASPVKGNDVVNAEHSLT